MNMMSSFVENKIAATNTQQRAAIESVVEGWEGKDDDFILPIIEGPPGTGKTTVGVYAASLYLLTEKKAQIAYLAYTNFAADKAHEDLIYKMCLNPHEVVRLTRPGIRDWNKGRIGCKSDLSDLLDNDKRRLSEAKILVSTLSSSNKIFNIFKHPLIIIDEFSQVSPPMFFSMLSNVSTSIYNPSGYALLGDPNQLPVITSQDLLRSNIGLYIIARKPYDSHKLQIQYRMHENVCDVVNGLRQALNTYPLISDEDIKKRTLSSYGYKWNIDATPDDFNDILDPKNPVILINTDSLPNYEQLGFGNSTYYSEEAVLTARLASIFKKSYLDIDGKHLIPQILTPYKAQLGEIKSKLEDPSLKNSCATIYRSQGREYPCVIISFARKNEIGKIGILKDFEMIAQTYVGCSRAQAKLVLLFSFDTFLGHGYRDFEFMKDRCDHSAVIVDSAPAEWGIPDD